MNKKCVIGVVGFGNRGSNLLKEVMLKMEDVEIRAVCDMYEDRVEEARKLVEEAGHTKVKSTTDYRELIAIKEIEAVVITCGWESHTDIACEAMEAGKYVGMEVGGAYDIQQCWRLVQTSEKTGMPCMMLENCCYGRNELLALNLVKKGLLGEVVHCTGGYCHELRDEITTGYEKRHYRLRNYLHRNCDNYNTHALGPIAKILGINRGNRMLTLTSVASKASGLSHYIAENREKFNQSLHNAVFHQGDIVNTIIRCANGETICLTLSTTLPRAYSRCFSVIGTKGIYEEQTNSLFLDGVHNKYEYDWKEQWGNVKDYYEEYDHPLWKQMQNEGIKGGHGGMDWLVFRAFFECVMKRTQTPIDVYDTATWMCVSVLSEQSVSLNGMPVTIPDFTCGKWMNRKTDIYEKI